MFRRRDGIARRRIDDDNAAVCGGLQVDAVYANTSPANDLQLLGRIDDLSRHMGHGTGHQTIIIGNAGNEACFVEIGLHIHIIMLAQQLYPFFRYIITY